MCLYPKLINNPKYRVTKKNGGRVPPVFDERIKKVAIGCGKCMECRKKKAREWQIRMTEEIRENKNGKFVTLTFNNESLKELDKALDIEIKGGSKKKKEQIRENAIATLAVRRFLERWRRKYKKSVRHWLVTELGHEGTKRIHLHGIIFTNESKEEIEERWGYGHIWVGEYVNEKTINYIIKYVTKIDLENKGYESKILTSQGIGKGYMKRTDWKRNKYKGEETEDTYIYKNGSKSKLPIYYRNKIYDEEQRERLWIDMLDEEKRYVLGKEICIKDGEDEYYAWLEEAQKKNIRLGYGDDSKKWKVRDYARERERLNNMISRDKGKIKLNKR